MPFTKRLTFAALLATSTLFITVLASADPGHDRQQIDGQKMTVAALYEQAEQASETYNDLQLQESNMQAAITSLQNDEERQRLATVRARTELKNMLINNYTGQTNLSSSVQLIASDNPQQFVDGMAAQQLTNDVLQQKYADYRTASSELSLRENSLAKQQQDLQALITRAAEEDKQINDAYAAAQTKLDTLKANHQAKALQRQEEELAVAQGSVADATPLASIPGRAQVAVQFAEQQVGDAYVYGAAGPDAWDCSGLMMGAWAQAGVALPHSAAVQSTLGTKVEEKNLQPGDLVFYYSPIHHVGMYVGNGMVVAAQNPHAGVQVVGLHSMPYMGAVRVA